MALNKRLFLKSGADSETNPFGDNSLKSFYRFDNNYNDDSGNNYTATAEAGVSFNSSEKKVGTHSLVNLGSATNRQISVPNDFSAGDTATFWTYLVNGSGDDNYWFMEKHDAAYHFLNFYFTNQGGDKRINAQSRGVSSSNYRYSSMSLAYAQNTWIFITYRYTTAGTHHASYNGGNEFQITPTHSPVGSVPPVPTSDKTIGQYFGNGSIYTEDIFYIDHYRSFNRALTNAEISQLYNEV